MAAVTDKTRASRGGVRRPGRRALAFLATVAALAVVHACSPAHEPHAVSDAPEADRFGLVVVSMARTATGHPADQTLTASAWFIETTAPRHEVHAMLGAPLVGARAPESVGQCLMQVRDLPSDALSRGSVYFLDAGEVTLEGEGGVVPLGSSWFPDVEPAISGLVYDTAIDEAGQWFEEPSLRVVGHGSAEVGAFSVAVQPPEPVRILGVGGLPVYGARLRGYSFSADGLHLAWRSASTSDTVVVELVRRGFDRVATLTCTVPDTGEFVLPRAALAQLPTFGPDQTDRLDVFRFRSAPFDADGLAEGTVTLVARDSVYLD